MEMPSLMIRLIRISLQKIGYYAMKVQEVISFSENLYHMIVTSFGMKVIEHFIYQDSFLITAIVKTWY